MGFFFLQQIDYDLSHSVRGVRLMWSVLCLFIAGLAGDDNTYPSSHSSSWIHQLFVRNATRCKSLVVAGYYWRASWTHNRYLAKEARSGSLSEPNTSVQSWIENKGMMFAVACNLLCHDLSDNLSESRHGGSWQLRRTRSTCLSCGVTLPKQANCLAATNASRRPCNNVSARPPGTD